MRLETYLTEKWFDTMKYSNLEIFKNPSKRDLKEIGTEYGYRVFIDLKNKNVYLANAETFHKTMLDTSDKLNKELKINWYAYWSGEDKTNEYIIMGNCNSHMSWFSSDALGDLAVNGGKEALERMWKLIKWDYKWLSKYGFDPREVKLTVEKYHAELIDRVA